MLLIPYDKLTNSLFPFGMSPCFLFLLNLTVVHSNMTKSSQKFSRLYVFEYFLSTSMHPMCLLSNSLYSFGIMLSSIFFPKLNMIPLNFKETVILFILAYSSFLETTSFKAISNSSFKLRTSIIQYLSSSFFTCES